MGAARRQALLLCDESASNYSAKEEINSPKKKIHEAIETNSQANVESQSSSLHCEHGKSKMKLVRSTRANL